MWQRKLAWTGIVLVATLAGLGLAGYLVLRSQSFHGYLLAEIQRQASQATGAQVRIQNFALHLSTFAADAYGITIRANQPENARPFARADQLTVRLKIVSLLRKKFNLNEIVLRHPVVNLLVAKDGTTNLPTLPESNSNGSSNPFDLGIRHVLVEQGEVYYNDVKTPLDAELHDLQMEIKSGFAPNSYDGSLSYRNGRIQYGTTKPLPHNLTASFTANPFQFSLKPLILSVASSTIQVEGLVQNYSKPLVKASYKVIIHSRDVGTVLKSVNVPVGQVTLAGSMNYQQQDNVPLIRALSLDGQLSGRELAVNVPDLHTIIRNVRGKFTLVNGNLDVRGLEAEMMSGHLTANATVEHLDGKSVGRVQASAQTVSLAEATSAIQILNPNQIPIEGHIDGTADATWTGDIKNIQAHSDVSLQAALIGAAARPVPVDGMVHMSYEGNSGVTTLSDTFVRTPETRVEMNGTAGPTFNLKIQTHAANLREVAELAAAFENGGARGPANAASANSLNVGGGADLQLLIEGSPNEPRFRGHLTGRNLHLENTEWRSLELKLQADKSHVSVENGSLVNAHQGYVNFAFSSALSNWRRFPSSPMTLQLTSQGLAIDQLLQLAKLNYPVSGILAVNVSMNGSQLEPQGNGSVRLTHAKIYGQPLQQLTLQCKGNGNALTSSLEASAPAGHAKANLVFYSKNKGYDFELDAPEVRLAELESLRERNLGIAGTLTATARGRGTLDNPQLTAMIQIPQLQIREANISGVKADLNVRNHKAEIALDSEVAQTLVQAHGSVDLAGAHDVRATLDSKGIPIEGLLALYAPVKSNGPRGVLEVHASAEGPLNDKTRLQAQVIIPTLKADYQGLQIGNTRPIRLHYANSVVSLDPMEIAGTDSTLRLQGQLPLRGSASATLSAIGTIDAQLLRFFEPDLQSSGKLLIDVRGSGTTDHPTVQGQLRLEDISVMHADAPVGLQNLNGVLDVGNDQVNITQLAGEVGGGQISARGTIRYRPQLQMNVALQGKNIRIRYHDAIRTVLGGDFNLLGTSQAATLNGRVLIDKVSFTQNFDLATVAGQIESGPESTPTQGPAEKVKLDISVQTSRDLNLTSSAASLQGQANLRVIGTLADPVIVGSTEFTSGDIFLMNKRYQIERGVIEFSNPNRTEPVLNVLLTATIKQYNLSLSFRGPLDKMKTSYISDPPLPTSDIINLITRGQTTQQAAAAPSNFGASSLLAQGAASQVSGGVQKLAGLSSLSIDPTLGGNDSDPGARIAMQKRVTNNFLFTFATDVTSTQRELIQGEYQLNKRWSASVTRDENGGFAIDGKYHKRY